MGFFSNLFTVCFLYDRDPCHFIDFFSISEQITKEIHNGKLKVIALQAVLMHLAYLW